MFGRRKVRSNKGKKRGPNKRTKARHLKITMSPGGTRHIKTRKIRSNKGMKRGPYGPRTGKTRSGKRFRVGGGNCGNPIKYIVASSKTKDGWLESAKKKKKPTLAERLGIEAEYKPNKGYVIKNVMSARAGQEGLKPGMVLSQWGYEPENPKKITCTKKVCGLENSFKTKRLSEKWPLDSLPQGKSNVTWWCP